MISILSHDEVTGWGYDHFTGTDPLNSQRDLRAVWSTRVNQLIHEL